MSSSIPSVTTTARPPIHTGDRAKLPPGTLWMKLGSTQPPYNIGVSFHDAKTYVRQCLVLWGSSVQESWGEATNALAYQQVAFRLHDVPRPARQIAKYIIVIVILLQCILWTRTRSDIPLNIKVSGSPISWLARGICALLIAIRGLAVNSLHGVIRLARAITFIFHAIYLLFSACLPEDVDY